MRDLLNGSYKNIVPSFQVIDCRYPYEYEGGHIKNAINIFMPSKLEEGLLRNPTKTILIFHCEFSQKRGPNLYRTLRRQDRACNIYPNLHYPEMYLLEGGFKKFYENSNEALCEPRAYISMFDKNHDDACKELTRRHKRDCEMMRDGRHGVRIRALSLDSRE